MGKPLELDEADMAELLCLARAGENWLYIEDALNLPGSCQTIRRRWTELSTEEQKRERKGNVAKRRASERSGDGTEPPGRDIIELAPECQFPEPGIYFQDDPRAARGDTGKVPERTVTWLPRQVAGGFK